MNKTELPECQGREKAEQKEDKIIEQLSPPLGEFEAVRTCVAKACLYGQSGDVGCNEHAPANRFAGEYAEDRQRHQTKLLNGFGHPLPTTGEAQEQTTDKPDGETHHRAHPQLLKDIVEQHTAGPICADPGHSNEKHEKGD
jgi:hypothetical protein